MPGDSNCLPASYTGPSAHRCRSRSLFTALALVALLGAGSQVLGDTERLREYYEQLLKEEPGNERARVFLGLSSTPTEPPQPLALSAWEKSLQHGDIPAALSLWQSEWKNCPPAERLELATAAIKKFPASELPKVAEFVLPQLAPRSGARRSTLSLLAKKFADSESRQEILSAWKKRAEAGEPDFAAAAAELAAETGEPELWADLLELQGRQGQPSDRLWEAYAAAGKMDKADAETARWLQTEPGSTAAFLARIEVLLLTGNVESAENLLRERLANSSASLQSALVSPLLSLAERLGWPTGAELALAKQLDAKPQDTANRLALISHYLTWRNPRAAAEVIGAAPENAAEFPVFLQQAAGMQMRAGAFADAVQTLRKALARMPQKPETEEFIKYIRQLVEASVLAGDRNSARDLLLQFYGPNTDFLPATEIDRDLFSLLATRSTAHDNSAPADATGDATSSLDLQKILPARRGITDAIREFVAGLELEAKRTGSATTWQRLARWLEWSDQPDRALNALRLGIRQNPKEPGLYEQALHVARKLRDSEAELGLLRQLSELEEIQSPAPAGSDPTRWRRELALAQLRSGDADAANEAMQFFRSRTRHPDATEPNASAWRDLALAHELREEWLAAHEAWKSAWQNSRTPQEQAEIRGAGERAASITGRSGEWASLTSSRVQPQPSQAQTAADFPEAPNPQSDLTAAVEKIRRTLRTLHSRDESAWLAEGARMQKEKADAAALQKFWSEAATRFPRSAKILMQAARSVRLQNPGQAAGWMSRAVSLAPPDAHRLADLANTLEQSGDRTRALDAWEQVLSLEPPPALPLPSAVYPVEISPEERRSLIQTVSRLRAASGSWSGGWAAVMERPPNAPPGLRVRAVKAMGRIYAASGGLGDEIRSAMRSLPRHEAVEFFVAAGQPGEAMEILRGAVTENPLDYTSSLSFLRLAMELDMWRDAVNFARENPEDMPERTDFFLMALGERILARKNWRTLIEFANQSPEEMGITLRWPVAELMAELQHPGAALELAGSLPPDLPEDARVSAAEEALEWSFTMGDVQKAREILRSAPKPQSGISDPAAGLLRARYLLASPSEQATLLEEHADNTANAFLLAALARQPLEDKAANLVREISTSASVAGDRRLFGAELRAAIEKLLVWRLEEAASSLASAALEADEALVTLRGQMDDWVRGELQALATAAAFSRQSLADLPASIISANNLLADQPDFLPSVAVLLGQTGDPFRASKIFEVLWRQGDRRPVMISTWWPLVRQTGNREAFALLLEESLRRGTLLEGVQNPWSRLLDLQIAGRNFDQAEELLKLVKERGISEPGLDDRAVAINFLKGEFSSLLEESDADWFTKKDARTGELLARAAWAGGEKERFARILPQLAKLNSGAALGVWDAALDDADNSSEDIRQLIGLLPQIAPDDSERHILGNLALQDLDAAAKLLEESSAFPSPELLGKLSRQPDSARQLTPAILERWRNLVDSGNPVAQEPKRWQAVDELCSVSGFDAQWSSMLEQLWRDGRGNRFAGEMLLRARARQKEEALLANTLETFLASRSDREFAHGLILFLNQHGFPKLALRVWEEWNKAGIPDAQRFTADLLRATSLDRAGDKQAARNCLAPWREIARVEADYLLALGDWYLGSGDAAEALRIYEEGMLYAPHYSRRAHAIGAAIAARACGLIATAEQYEREAMAMPAGNQP